MAFGKSTNQSSFDEYGRSSSKKAVDGISSTIYSLGSCSHTDHNEPKPWWRVDLGRVEPVTEVYIVNRGECCGFRLSAFQIRVGRLHLQHSFPPLMLNRIAPCRNGTYFQSVVEIKLCTGHHVISANSVYGIPFPIAYDCQQKAQWGQRV